MKRSAVLVIACSFLSEPDRAQAQNSNPWRELARRDLQAVRETILDHHPGPVDSLNPGYRDWLERGYARALQMADSVVSLDGLIAVISFYTSGFEDGHLGWGPDFTRSEVRWPGIVVARRDERFVVQHIADWVTQGPTIGAELLQCDGVTMQDRLKREVMPFHQGISSLEASQVRLAPLTLVWDGNPWASRPRSCRVREHGQERDVGMTWRSVSPTAIQPLLDAAVYGTPPATFAITFPASDVAWITVPSLAENVGDNRGGLDSLVRGLPNVRHARLIVFDVRGNRGGNSRWGDQLAAALFGSEYIQTIKRRVWTNTYIEWRTSAANADFVERATLPRFQVGSPAYDTYRRLVATLRAARSRGAELVRPDSDVTPPGLTPQHELAPRVVLLTDGWCASACLDLADLILAIPGVRHAGTATYADAIYIDNRAILLPSQLGYFGFSMKVYRNRKRKHNQPYVPALVYRGASWETTAVQSWLIEAARSAPSRTASPRP